MEKNSQQFASQDNLVFASKKRLFLAWYIDYCLISVIIGHISIHFFGAVDVPLYIEIPFLMLFEALFFRGHSSPGMKFLSIASRRVELTREGVGTKMDTVKVVDDFIYHNETWFTMLLGVLLINEGSKSLIRWAMWTPPLPFLGFATDESSFPLIAISSGLVTIYAAYLLLRLSKKGFFVALFLQLLGIANVALSWGKLPAIAEIMVQKRRAYQGIPVRSGEIEFMQTAMPGLLVGFLLLHLILLLMSYRHLRAEG